MLLIDLFINSILNAPTKVLVQRAIFYYSLHSNTQWCSPVSPGSYRWAMVMKARTKVPHVQCLYCRQGTEENKCYLLRMEKKTTVSLSLSH